MYRLLALDLDGTLLEEDQSIPVKVIIALRNLIKQGIVVTLATGRMFTSVKKFANQIGINAPLISYNGAVVREPSANKASFEEPLTSEQMHQVFTVCKQHSYYLQIYNDEHIVIEKRVRYTEIDPDIDLANKNYFEVDSFLSPNRKLGNTPKILTCGNPSPSEMSARHLILKDALPDLNIVSSLNNSAERGLIEIMNKDVSKASALAKLCEMLGVSPSECVVCGDAPNDIEMIKWAGMGCAVANAVPDVKKAARYTAIAQRSLGVLEIIRTLF